MNSINIPIFKTNNKEISEAFKIAYSDLIASITPYNNGLIDEEKPVIMAGLGYDTPWTRDAAINTWNGAGLLLSDISKDTLLSVLIDDNGAVRIGGQYWDAIIWAVGAWWEYLYTGDKEFLSLSLNAVKNSLKYFEETEFDSNLNLFRGPACYGDGVAAYPDIYACGSSGIESFPTDFPELAYPKGVGIPMHTLSTNCLYYYAYVLIDKMANELNVETDKSYAEKAEKLKNSVNRHFYLADKDTYRYIVDDFGNCDYQEGMGLSFAILFGIADKEQAASVFNNIHISPQGIPCVWPSFSRYSTSDGSGFGRHSGTVWPHIESFFADAACKCGRGDLFENELRLMAARAVRDGQFAEIYHPLSGQIYGGRQERYNLGVFDWKSELKQTWSATGFIRMILMNLIGMDFAEDGIHFSPCPVCGITDITLKNITYRNMTLDISISGSGKTVDKFVVNGQSSEKAFVSADLHGSVNVNIIMK